MASDQVVGYDDAAGDEDAGPLADIVFPTFVFRHQLDDWQALNAVLLRLILNEREADSEGILASNVAKLGGWHSHNGLHHEPVFQHLVTAIHRIADGICRRLDYDPTLEMRIDQMWAIVNPPGAYNTQHTHPHSLWSGVYYVQVPEASGSILFKDPRPGSIMFSPRHKGRGRARTEFREVMEHKAIAGQSIIFPSFLPHAVEPNLSRKKGDDALRVAISFNLTQHLSRKER